MAIQRMSEYVRSKSEAGLPDVSIVVPLHNEAGNIGPLVAAIESALSAFGASWELIAVNDGSTDGSLGQLCEQRKTRPWLRILSLEENRGQSAAIAMGLRAVRAPIVVTIDGDLQNDARDIATLLEQLDHCDVASGVRINRRDTWQRRVSSRVANSVRRCFTGDELTDIGCSLKAYRMQFLLGVPCFDGMHRVLPLLAQRNGARVREFPVRHHGRRHGKSHYGVGNRLWWGWVDLWGLFWLQRRWISDTKVQELSEPREIPAKKTTQLLQPPPTTDRNL